MLTRLISGHQLCHLDSRSAEAQGQEPTTSDSDFTTFLPQNISDENLQEDTVLSTNPLPGFTDMTTHLMRLNAVHCFRRVVQRTYQIERQVKSSRIGDPTGTNTMAKLRTLYDEVHTMVDTMLEKHQTLYLKYCDTQDPMHKIALELSPILEWRCWAVFWFRVPRAYRDVVFSPEVRTA